jgi:hypothetical protein
MGQRAGMIPGSVRHLVVATEHGNTESLYRTLDISSQRCFHHVSDAQQYQHAATLFSDYNAFQVPLPISWLPTHCCGMRR